MIVGQGGDNACPLWPILYCLAQIAKHCLVCCMSIACDKIISDTVTTLYVCPIYALGSLSRISSSLYMPR